MLTATALAAAAPPAVVVLAAEPTLCPGAACAAAEQLCEPWLPRCCWLLASDDCEFCCDDGPRGRLWVGRGAGGGVREGCQLRFKRGVELALASRRCRAATDLLPSPQHAAVAVAGLRPEPLSPPTHLALERSFKCECFDLERLSLDGWRWRWFDTLVITCSAGSVGGWAARRGVAAAWRCGRRGVRGLVWRWLGWGRQGPSGCRPRQQSPGTTFMRLAPPGVWKGSAIVLDQLRRRSVGAGVVEQGGVQEAAKVQSRSRLAATQGVT